MADDIDIIREFRNHLARPVQPYYGAPSIEKILAEPDNKVAAAELWKYVSMVINIATGIHEMGILIKGKVDCETLSEIRMWGNTQIFHRSSDFVKPLSQQATIMLARFELLSEKRPRGMLDEDVPKDDQLWEMYKGLARTAAKFVNAFHSDLQVRDPLAGRRFKDEVFWKLQQFGCGKLKPSQ